MAQTVTLAEVVARLVAVEATLQAGGAPQCTAALPHQNQLVFMRGPNKYLCQCGKVYVKDGMGGLKDGT